MTPTPDLSDEQAFDAMRRGTDAVKALIAKATADLEAEKARIVADYNKAYVILHGKVLSPVTLVELAERVVARIAALEAENAALKAELDKWKPLTPEEAQKAYDEAEAMPLSEDRIKAIVDFARDPGAAVPNFEQMQLAVDNKRLRAANAALASKLAHVEVYGEEACGECQTYSWDASVETGIRFCRYCRCNEMRRDAVQMEKEFREANAALVKQVEEAKAESKGWERELSLLRDVVRNSEEDRDQRDRYARYLTDIGRAIGCGHLDERLANCVEEVVADLRTRAEEAEERIFSTENKLVADRAMRKSIKESLADSPTQEAIPCRAHGPHHGDECNGGRVQAPNAQFTEECRDCGGTGEATPEAAKDAEVARSFSLWLAKRWADTVENIEEKIERGVVSEGVRDAFLAGHSKGRESRQGEVDEAISMKDYYVLHADPDATARLAAATKERDTERQLKNEVLTSWEIVDKRLRAELVEMAKKRDEAIALRWQSSQESALRFTDYLTAIRGLRADIAARDETIAEQAARLVELDLEVDVAKRLVGELRSELAKTQ